MLTRQWLETDQGLELVFWFATDSGPVRLRVAGAEAVFFVATSQLDRVTSLLSDAPSHHPSNPPSKHAGPRFGQTQLQNFQFDKLTAVYCKSQRILLDCRQLLTEAGVPVLEGDIKPVDRYLMERFITGAASLLGKFEARQGFEDVFSCRLKPVEYRPDLRSVSVDIETSYSGTELYSIAAYSDRDSRVYMIADDATAKGRAVQSKTAIKYVKNEREAILGFLDWVKEDDPDVIIGWNVINFDLRFLEQCCERLGLKFRLGRDDQTIRWRQARTSANRYYATVPGRLVLDGIEVMRNATYQFENFSLEHVARQLLQRGKLIDDIDERGAEISRLFREDKAKLAAYNLEDCKLVWDIFQGEKLIEFAVERSLLTGLEPDRSGGSVAAFDFLYLPRLHRRGFAAPSVGDSVDAGLSPGGYVMDSVPGIYRHVIVLDFKSLYPSIIRTFYVDPLALARGLHEEDAVPGFDGGQFSRHHFLLPELIENLWAARDRAKANGDKVLSQAIKIIMNSFYGVLGTPGCRFFDKRLVSSITRRGHEIIQKTRDVIEDQGYQVIYGDTDSVFVLIDSTGEMEVKAIGDNLASSLNRFWTRYLGEKYDIASCLEIQFETHFDKFLMPRIRNAETGSKKRYAGLVRNGRGPEDFTLVFKGLESVRSDWSPLAREFQQTLYRLLFLEEPYEEFIKTTAVELLNGAHDDKLVIRKRLRRNLGEYVKNVPPHVQAARKAESTRASRGLPTLFTHGGWIEYVMTVNGPEPKQYLESRVDYDFYLERQLYPVADAILVFKSTSMKQLLDRQINLF